MAEGIGRGRANAALSLASIGIVLAIAAVVIPTSANRSLQAEHEAVAARVSRVRAAVDSLAFSIEMYNQFRDAAEMEGAVDLSEPIIQRLGGGFSAVRLEVNEHLTGVKVGGRIINTQSVAHESAVFSIYVGGQTKEFTINRISPGNSTAFSVYLPDADSSARYGRITYVRSMVRYAAG